VLANAKAQAKGAYCLNNLRQIQLSWLMYCSDFKDSLPGNYWQQEDLDVCGSNWLSGEMEINVAGWKDNTNYDLFMNPQYASMGPYIKNSKIYQCCASTALAAESPSPQPLCRDVSMNNWLGYQNDPTPADTNAGFVPFRKISDLQGHTPQTGFTFGPAVALIFIDEYNLSIDDGEFLINETVDNQIANIPAFYHGGNSGGVTFGDGHAEIHKWVTIASLVPAQPGGVVSTSQSHINFVNCPTTPPDVDLKWLQLHATYSKTADVTPGQ